MTNDQLTVIYKTANAGSDKLSTDAIFKAMRAMQSLCAEECRRVDREYGECPELAQYCAEAIESMGANAKVS